MVQKVIKVGNSFAVTIPQAFAREIGLTAGENVRVEQDTQTKSLYITVDKASEVQSSITPEFLTWLKKFNTKHKAVLSELAKK